MTVAELSRCCEQSKDTKKWQKSFAFRETELEGKMFVSDGMQNESETKKSRLKSAYCYIEMGVLYQVL